MRFRAKCSKAQLSLLSSLLPSLSHLSRDRAETSALLLSPALLSVATCPPSAQLSGYLSLPMRSVFADFRLDSREGDAILLEFDPSHLASALRSLLSAAGAEHAQVKLQKKGGAPYLVLETLGACAASVAHDVPVKIMRLGSDLAGFEPPALGAALVAVLLPAAAAGSLLRPAVERLRLLAQAPGSSAPVRLALLAAGEVHLSVEQDGFAAKCYFDELEVDFEGAACGGGEGGEPDRDAV
ncbi:hypothetical protein TeGR_g5495, partial [Tetraparma gracilis]